MVTEQAQRLAADPTGGDLARHIIDFDPRQPQHYLFAAAPTTPQAVRLAAGQLHPDPIPWPTSLTPQAQPFDPATTDTSPLPQADVLVVTYTVAEGDGLADVLTPGMQNERRQRHPGSQRRRRDLREIRVLDHRRLRDHLLGTHHLPHLT